MAVALAGCGPYTADLGSYSVTPPTLLVARPIPRKLFIVVGGNVEDDFTIRNSRHSVRGFRRFMGRTLKNTFRPYFHSVEIVSTPPTPAQTAAAGPSAVADVRVDGVEARYLPAGDLIYITFHIQWAFAVRLAEADDYLFSFAGTGISERSFRTLEQGFEQLMLSAVSGLMQRWVDDEVFDAFLRPPTSGGQTPQVVDPFADEPI